MIEWASTEGSRTNIVFKRYETIQKQQLGRLQALEARSAFTGLRAVGGVVVALLGFAGIDRLADLLGTANAAQAGGGTDIGHLAEQLANGVRVIFQSDIWPPVMLMASLAVFIWSMSRAFLALSCRDPFLGTMSFIPADLPADATWWTRMWSRPKSRPLQVKLVQDSEAACLLAQRLRDLERHSSDAKAGSEVKIGLVRAISVVGLVASFIALMLP